MEMYKFLQDDGKDETCAWPLPEQSDNGWEPGEWVTLPYKVVDPSRLWSRLRLYPAEWVGHHMGSKLYVAEFDPNTEPIRAAVDHGYAGLRARLLRPVSTWNPRTQRILATRCVRRVWHLLPPRGKDLVKVARSFADGEATAAELDAARVPNAEWQSPFPEPSASILAARNDAERQRIAGAATKTYDRISQWKQEAVELLQHRGDHAAAFRQGRQYDEYLPSAVKRAAAEQADFITRNHVESSVRAAQYAEVAANAAAWNGRGGWYFEWECNRVYGSVAYVSVAMMASAVAAMNWHHFCVPQGPHPVEYLHAEWAWQRRHMTWLLGFG